MSRTQSTMVELGTQAPPFELPDVTTGRAFSRDDIAALAWDDNLSDQATNIGRDYEGKIAICAISSNDVEAFPQDSPAEMKAQAQRLDFRFPYLYDETQEVARAYSAACTPDFFLFDAQLNLVYRGQLDDSRPRRGDFGNDLPVTGHDLRHAMDEVIRGVRPDPNQRFSIGCNIKWRE
jgi:hypothetical protein